MPPRVDPIGWGSRHWGIEFEFTRTCTQEALEEAVRYALPDLPKDMLRVADWEHTPNNNREWVVKRDGSCGWEICTPKSKSLADMERVAKVLAACKLVGAQVGPFTGVHIHFETRELDTAAMGKLVALWVKCEGMLFWSLPRGRRANRYCLTLTRGGDIKSRGRYEPDDLLRIAGASRYRALNLKPWLGDCGRIEVRIIEGLVDGDEVRNWTSYFLYWIQRVLAADFPQDLKWFGLEEYLAFMGWSPEVPMEWAALEALRIWWLKRFIKYSSVRAKPGLHRVRAKRCLAQIQGVASAV